MSPNHSRDIWQARVNELQVALGQVMQGMKLELESCRLVLYPPTFQTVDLCRSNHKGNAETIYLTHRLRQLRQKKAKEKNQENQWDLLSDPHFPFIKRGICTRVRLYELLEYIFLFQQCIYLTGCI